MAAAGGSLSHGRPSPPSPRSPARPSTADGLRAWPRRAAPAPGTRNSLRAAPAAGGPASARAAGGARTGRDAESPEPPAAGPSRSEESGELGRVDDSECTPEGGLRLGAANQAERPRETSRMGPGVTNRDLVPQRRAVAGRDGRCGRPSAPHNRSNCSRRFWRSSGRASV
jgi:hypothetical protein